MRAGAITPAIVQIHPTRHCNLRCRHCYSLSGPRTREALAPDAIAGFLAQARAQGYAIASFSGGEPLLYPHFFACAARARALGFGVMVTTNGTLIDPAAAERLTELADLVAISIDGPPDMHNAMRGSATAFDNAVRGIAAVRAAGMRFGIIHTVTAASLPHVRWLHGFAREQGAALLQLHPLEPAGRGETMDGEVPTSEIATRLSLLASVLEEAEPDGPRIQVDLFDRRVLAMMPALVYAGEECGRAGEAPLAALVNPLVLEQNGDVVPIAYGFGRRYRVCNIHERSLAEALPDFRREAYSRLRALCRALYEEIAQEDDLPYFNWYDRVTRASCAAGSPAPAGAG